MTAKNKSLDLAQFEGRPTAHDAVMATAQFPGGGLSLIPGPTAMQYADERDALLAECKHQRETLAIHNALFEQANEKMREQREQIAKLRGALEDLTLRCDGAEGIRADGSNIQTIKAHAALGTFAEEE